MSKILGLLLGYLTSGCILLILFTFVKVDFLDILGGNLLLFFVLPLFDYYSKLFKRYNLELQFFLLILLGIFAWQYLNYYEINKSIQYNTVLILFIVIELIIYVAQLYIIGKPIYHKKNAADEDSYEIKRIISTSILSKVGIYCFAGFALSFIFGAAIHVAHGSYVISNHIISFVPIGIFWIIMSNIIAYLSVKRIDDKFLNYVYQKRDVDLVKIIKFIQYLFGTLFVLGGVIEIFTRENFFLYLVSYVLIFSSILLMHRIYRLENIKTTEETIDKASVDAIRLDYKFYLKYILGLMFIGATSFILFIKFLFKIKP